MREQLLECSDELLLRILSQESQHEIDAAAVKHVEQCEKCQCRLEELAATVDQWRDVRSKLSSFDSLEYGEEEKRYLVEGNTTGRTQRDKSWMEEFTRQWLQPPSHPEMLGRIGRFDIERWIGSGGMGVVYKAFDTELNRPVAIKILAPYLAGIGAARQRFGREARAAAAIVHEHVVAIHNVESNSESPYLVMQFVSGESLQQRLDRVGSLELCEILRIAKQTAAGLAAAHAQGLVHRDVKPSNILLEEGIERALLTDFGLARAADDASLTHTGYHPGTPEFMSPEQARGEPVDARSDLFSLGSVIYTMCTGRTPFRAESSYGVLRKITDAEPVAIRELNPAIPEWLVQLIEKLHAKEVNHRWATAREVHDLLEGCLAHVQNPLSVDLPIVLQKRANRSWFDLFESVSNSGETALLDAHWQKRLTVCGCLLVVVGVTALVWQTPNNRQARPVVEPNTAGQIVENVPAMLPPKQPSIANSTRSDDEAIEEKNLDWELGDSTISEVEAGVEKILRNVW